MTIPILSGRTLQLTILDTPPAQRVRSISRFRLGRAQKRQAPPLQLLIPLRFWGFSGPAVYRSGLKRLSAGCPAEVPDDRWRLALADAERFLVEWGETAERLGWTKADLFDLHPTVPLSRMDRIGLVWLLEGERVALLTETEARNLECGLAVYRQPARTRAAP